MFSVIHYTEINGPGYRARLNSGERSAACNHYKPYELRVNVICWIVNLSLCFGALTASYDVIFLKASSRAVRLLKHYVFFYKSRRNVCLFPQHCDEFRRTARSSLKYPPLGSDSKRLRH